jgi:ribosomal-protein-alanine N-acetyltransferase
MRDVTSFITEPLTATLRPMRVDDAAAAAAIERASFERGWTPAAFRRELTQNRVARYAVAVVGGDVAAFAGLWVVLDEGHVVTVAVAPHLRRRGLGRLMVHALTAIALGHELDSLTLECRPSNEAARALYRKYGFYEVGRRKRYYADGEDALIMATESLRSAAYQERLRRLEAELEALIPGSAIQLRAVQGWEWPAVQPEGSSSIS